MKFTQNHAVLIGYNQACSLHSFSTQSLVITLSYTIPNSNDPMKKPFWKHFEKRRKCCLPAFSPFPTMFSALSKTEITILTTFYLSSANAFNLDLTKILSFGKELMTMWKKAFQNVFEKVKMIMTSMFSFS